MYDTLNLYLENGLRVVIHRIPHIKTMSCGIWIGQGSKHECDQSSGLSHLLEHMTLVFDYEKTPKQLVADLSCEGAVYNAGTTKEHTFYHFSGLARTLPRCLEALYTLVCDERDFSQEALDNEKKVVLQEASSFYSSFNQIKERTTQALYGNLGVGRIIVGSPECIQNATLDDIQSIKSKRYVPENATLVIVGGIEYEQALHAAENVFSRWADRICKDEKDIIEGDPSIFFKSDKNVNSSVVSIGFRTGSFFTKDRIGIEILSKIIGESGLESRLVNEIRQKRGMAYTVGSFTTAYEKRGSLGMTVACNHDQVEDIIKIIMNEINDVKTNGVTEEELGRAKRILETRTLMDLDNLLSQLKFLGKTSSYGYMFSLEQEIRNINKYSIEELKILTNELFHTDNMGFAAIGAFDIDEMVTHLVL